MAAGSAAVLERLRSVMRSSKYVSEPLTAYIIPTDDAHQNEYIANCDKRREFMIDFTGSAGSDFSSSPHAHFLFSQ
jgi:Xaa-Pro aminopeptidase